MRTDPAAILTLSQWLSPSYPVGAFAYSHGLEWAAVADVTGPGDLRDWICDVLRNGAGRADALFLAAAFRAETGGELAEIDALCRAFAPSRERLCETEQQGAAFCRATADVWRLDLPDLVYPVAVGRAAALCALPPVLTGQMYLHAFAANLVMAATRLMPLGQTAAQRLIRDLAPLCRQIAEETADGDLNEVSGTAFLADIASMKHETQATRIFRT